MSGEHLKSNEKSISTSIQDKNELVGWIIERMYHIEWKINNIIIDYFNPERTKEFETVLLNSTIIPVGSKLKILRNIGSFDKKIIGKLQELTSIRNGFAHLPYNKHIIITVGSDSGGVKEDHSLAIMGSDGQIKLKKVSEQLQRFNEIHSEVNPYLLSFKQP